MPISLATLHEPYSLVRELQGERLRGLTFRIQNETQTPQILSEPDLAKALPFKLNRIIALLISKKTLNPGEGTDVYVVARAN
jgi:hypothetical protein